MAIANKSLLLTTSNSRRIPIDYEISKASHKNLIAILTSTTNEPIAYLSATAYRLNGASPSEFLEACDAISQEAASVSGVLDAHWRLEDLDAKADILSIERVCVHPKYAGRGIIAHLMMTLLPTLSRKPSITILKAFPLQFECIENPDPVRFKALQDALADYYARYLGVARLPSTYGAKGWMYASTIPLDEWADAL